MLELGVGISLPFGVFILNYIVYIEYSLLFRGGVKLSFKTIPPLCL